MSANSGGQYNEFVTVNRGGKKSLLLLVKNSELRSRSSERAMHLRVQLLTQEREPLKKMSSVHVNNTLPLGLAQITFKTSDTYLVI